MGRRVVRLRQCRQNFYVQSLNAKLKAQMFAFLLYQSIHHETIAAWKTASTFCLIFISTFPEAKFIHSYWINFAIAIYLAIAIYCVVCIVCYTLICYTLLLYYIPTLSIHPKFIHPNIKWKKLSFFDLDGKS